MKLFRSHEQRWALRQKRLEMWDRPITTVRQRIHAWSNLLFSDHGVLRLFYLNEHRLTEQMWRSAQPAPHDIARLARAGVRTIINLRGGREHGAWPLQREACEQHGIELRELTLRSRELPDRETLLGLPEFFESIAYPALAHCKSGADRAGLFSAIYVLLMLKGSAAEARKQLSFRFGHARLAKTGVLDAFIDAYERDGERQGLSFMDWVRDVYDPVEVGSHFEANYWASLVVDKVMRRE